MTPSTHPGQARRHFLLAILGATILLSGCQTRRERPRLPDPETRPVRPVVPIDRPRNLVAVIVPTSGSDAAIGQSIANAATLALADSGDQTLRLTIYDSAAPGGAAGAARRAIDDGNRLILGPLLAGDVRAVAPIARRAEVPVVAFSNDERVAGGGVHI
nr:ABC transporter substrate-binding protein [Sphingomonas sp.]